MINKIIIGADIVPTESNILLFEQASVRDIIGDELFDILSDSCYLICNLETPLVNSSSPILKCGPCFSTPTSVINGLKKMGIDLISLANNHILDQGRNGIISTCETLQREHISYLGVGENEKTACKPFFFSFMNKTIGVYSCVEHEFSAATSDEYGANAFDPLISLDHITEMREQCDYIIVLYHGGKEYYRYPSPGLQKICRRIVDKGANLVVCQHSHCIGARERYKNAEIVYGQGNFIFNKKDDEFWNSSLLVTIDEHFQIGYMPIVRTIHGTRLANLQEKSSILSDFEKRSEEIKDVQLLIKNYDSFSSNYLYAYISAFHGKDNIFIRLINKITKGLLTQITIKQKYSPKQLSMIRNYIECEAHRELVLNTIANYIDSQK